MGTLKVINPFDQSIYFEAPYLTWPEVEDAVSKARSAFERWRQVPLSERIHMVLEGMQYFKEHYGQVATDLTRQMGKPIVQSRNEINRMFERATYMASIAEETLAPETLTEMEGFERTILNEPHGVVLDIAAWNYPLLIAVNVIVPALLSGNVVLIKHSSRTPLCGEHFARALGNLGEHRGLVRNLILDHRNTEQLITSGLIDHVSFTGSKNGGHDIYTATARNFIEVGLELGGKDPAYVAPDADLDFSVANLVDGAMYNAGQSCCGIERVYVHAGLYDRFIEKAEKLIADYKLGDPMSEETTMGPLAMKSTLALCEKQVVEANSKGARLFGGGKQLRIGKGNFFEPTLIADIPNNHLSIMQEENFGPVLPVMKVESDEQAINLMNDSI
jgi:acyl-CoA reductase-like NAD-dependent aldehyde dehydrogenase